MEQVATNIAAESHRRSGSEPNGPGCEQDLHEREPEHQSTKIANGGVVALQHTLVDDAGVERWQRERGEGLDRLEDDHDAEDLAIRPKVGAQELAKLHG